MTAERSHAFSCCKNLFKTPAQHKKFLFVTVLLLLFYTCAGKYVSNDQFDYFVFSQRWLPTACIEYVEHHSSPSDQHHCILPKNFATWTIHGLWPTQSNHMGPFYCNRSLVFDVKKLTPIESELKLNWPNIEGEKGVASLWQHEWEKHGTCAAQLESLSSEVKYFSTALKLFKILTLQNFLTKNNILPKSEGGINVFNLINLIKNAYGKLPQIHCIHEVKTNRPYLSEIRFCYNKKLELMDCGNIKTNKLNTNLNVKNKLTNCPLNAETIYPQSINILKLDKPSLESSSKTDYYDSLVNMLRIIRFLQWASI